MRRALRPPPHAGTARRRPPGPRRYRSTPVRGWQRGVPGRARPHAAARFRLPPGCRSPDGSWPAQAGPAPTWAQAPRRDGTPPRPPADRRARAAPRRASCSWPPVWGRFRWPPPRRRRRPRAGSCPRGRWRAGSVPRCVRDPQRAPCRHGLRHPRTGDRRAARCRRAPAGPRRRAAHRPHESARQPRRRDRQRPGRRRPASGARRRTAGRAGARCGTR